MSLVLSPSTTAALTPKAVLAIATLQCGNYSALQQTLLSRVWIPHQLDAQVRPGLPSTLLSHLGYPHRQPPLFYPAHPQNKCPDSRRLSSITSRGSPPHMLHSLPHRCNCTTTIFTDELARSRSIFVILPSSSPVTRTPFLLPPQGHYRHLIITCTTHPHPPAPPPPPAPSTLQASHRHHHYCGHHTPAQADHHHHHPL